jgi:hypothetical protein
VRSSIVSAGAAGVSAGLGAVTISARINGDSTLGGWLRVLTTANSANSAQCPPTDAAAARRRCRIGSGRTAINLGRRARRAWPSVAPPGDAWQLARPSRSDAVRSSAAPGWPTLGSGRRLVRVSVSGDNESAPRSAVPPAFGERRVNREDRRALTLRTLLTSSFAPRRRDGRRAGEQELPVDFHEPYLLTLAVLMLLLSVADAFFTVTLLSGGATEANPLLAFVLDEHPRWFAVTKMALTGAGVVLLVAMARTRVFRIVRAKVFFQGIVVAYSVLVAYEAWLVSTRV